MACTASNERFCVIAAVSPQIMRCKLANYYPAGSSVEAATTQSRRPVIRQRGTVRADTARNKVERHLQLDTYSQFDRFIIASLENFSGKSGCHVFCFFRIFSIHFSLCFFQFFCQTCQNDAKIFKNPE